MKKEKMEIMEKCTHYFIIVLIQTVTEDVSVLAAALQCRANPLH